MEQSFVQSRYNYIIEQAEKTYWFNGISRKYMVVNKDLSNKLQSVCNINSGILKEKSPKLYKQLLEGGFLVDNKVDEVDIIRKKHKEAIESKNYFMIVLPTLNCNYKCWYCIQDHINTQMTEQTMEALKNHIEYMINEEHITSLHIEWFGGEPFMYFDEVVQPISEFAIALCQTAKIEFINTVTTNAYYLNETLYKRLEQLEFANFHITLDGIREAHNAVKFKDEGHSAFDHALNQINGLLSATEKPYVLLRINYTGKNLDERIVDQVNEVVLPKNRSRVTVYFRRVWQEQTDTNRSDKINELLQKFYDAGYQVQSLDVAGDFTACYTDKKYFNTFNYNGHVVKCSANDELYADIPLGKLQSNGKIVWQEGFLHKFHTDRFENGVCTKCKQLPVCMGPCANRMGEDFVCKRAQEDRSIEDIIVKYIDFSEKTH